MREIKFRALDPDGNWMYWNMEDAYSDYIYYMGERKEGTEVQQYTGLKDKNHKEIYEGDILKDEYWQQIPAQVLFHKGSFYKRTQTYSDTIIYSNHYIDHFNDEVIGNIYENKELLNESIS